MIRFWIIIKILYILSLVFGIHTSFAQEPGISEKEILIGTTTPLSGPFAGIGTQISKIGAQTYFRHINDTGGINGRRIINKISDDSFNPEKAVKNAKTLIKKDKVFCLFANCGTHTTLAITSLLKKHKIPLFSPISLSRKLVIPLNRYLFLMYPDYFTQAQKIISYTKSMDRKRVAIMYVDNYLGMEGVLGIKKAIEGSELKLVDEIKINLKDVDFGSQILRLKQGTKPGVVILFTPDIQAAMIVKQAKSFHFAPQFIVTLPFTPQRFLKSAGSAAEEVVAMTIVPDATISPKAGVAEYRNLLKEYFPGQKPECDSLIGYTSAKVLVEGLKRAGKDITRQRFIKALESLKKYETDIIYPVTFTPKNHLGTRCPFFNRITDGEFKDFKGDCGGEG